MVYLVHDVHANYVEYLWPISLGALPILYSFLAYDFDIVFKLALTTQVPQNIKWNK